MNEITQDELDRLNAQGEGYALGDFIGRRGVERFFERRLRGKDGSRKEVVNARGETIQELNELHHRGGDGRQHPGRQRGAPHRHAAAGRGRAGLPRARPARWWRWTSGPGFILAMVSRPGFDPNVLTGRVTPAQLQTLNRDPLQPMIFRPAQQHYSPGSTFKPVSMLAALGSKSFTPHSTVNCGGGYRLGARLWRCHKDAGHGLVDARRALQQSCDTWFYKVADTLGLDPIAAMGRELRPRRADRRGGGGRGAGHHAGQRVPRPGHAGRVHQGHGAQQRHRPGRRQRDAAAAHDGVRHGGQRRAPLPAAAGAAARDVRTGGRFRNSSPRSSASWTSTPMRVAWWWTR